MIKQAFGLAFATAFSLGSTAHAADLTVVPEDVVIAAPSFNWTGFYAGVHAGYGKATLDSEMTDTYGEGNGNKPDGFFGGGQLGYNYQFSNNIVLGIEADAAFADLKDNGALRIGDRDQYFEVGTRSKITALGTVRARAGYAVDRFLPYVTGGFAWANAESEVYIASNIPNASNVSSSDSQVFTGWTIGAGLEYAVTNNITAKVEYLYADLGSNDFTANVLGGSGQYNADLSSLQTVKFGLNYKF
ncbi:outer membrane protein [Kaistia terrae]|uniref:Outer membrane protein n=1 Tax=Kaistia terrae TaxID=537017 RepID=A0ABW0PUB3_9HYPH|nr:outer membrane protein [Kaistia terrae]MCX5576841.1 porin family protein [Kaistia terrae]